MNEQEILEYFRTQSEKYLPKKINTYLFPNLLQMILETISFLMALNKNQMFFQNIVKAIYHEHCANNQNL